MSDDDWYFKFHDALLEVILLSGIADNYVDFN